MTVNGSNDGEPNPVSEKSSNEKTHFLLVPQHIKVPNIITWQFWVVKSCCTTVGETVSDQFNVGFGLGLGGAAALFFPIMTCSLALNFYLDRYIPALYWFNVIMMSICGTIATDGLHDDLGVELWIENIVFFCLMCLAFVWWYRVEGTIDIHSIFTMRREGFYWLTVILTFALGTAIGDGISEAAGLGYGPTFGLFVGAIVFFALLWYYRVTGPIASFWLVFIMTRPLGAALGDCLASPTLNFYKPIVTVNDGLGNASPTSMPTPRPTVMVGGAGLGYGYTSLIFIVVIFVLVAWMQIAQFDQFQEGEEVDYGQKMRTAKRGSKDKITPYDSVAVVSTGGIETDLELAQIN